MASTAAGEGIQYENTTITGEATALLGNKYGDIFNIQQATFLLSTAPITDDRDGHCKVVRQNRVFPDAGYTVETITTFDNGRVHSKRGSSQQIELRWERPRTSEWASLAKSVVKRTAKTENSRAGLSKYCADGSLSA